MEVFLMRIANPIYDAVFKYLMDDNRIAKKLLSLIIGIKIKSIKLTPKEFEDKIENKSWTIFRIDFAAEIILENGSIQKVIIEVQKAKFASDIMRFRRYLGSQYRDKNNIYTDQRGKNKAMPIVSIYILGQPLGDISAPIIKVGRFYQDLTKNTKINTKNEFIEALTHDSFIIQVPLLNKKGRTKLERVLSVFENKEAYQHFVNIDENNYPEEYADIIRRLTKAAAEPDVMDKMDIEDELIEEFEEIERELEKTAILLEEKELQLKEKRNMIQKKELQIEEKVKLLKHEAKRAEQEAKRADQEAKRAEQAELEKEKFIQTAIQTLVKQGLTEKEARNKLGF
jgi:hypothetical protein